jgi:hypothetical protein
MVVVKLGGRRVNTCAMKFSTPPFRTLWLLPLLLAACAPKPIDMQTHYAGEGRANSHPSASAKKRSRQHATPEATPSRMAQSHRSAPRPTPKPQQHQPTFWLFNHESTSAPARPAPKSKPAPAPKPKPTPTPKNKPAPAPKPKLAPTPKPKPISTPLTRTAPPAAKRDQPARQAGHERAASKYPVAKKSFKDGYVISPYTGARIPVGKVPHGAQVLDPSSEKVFINP